MLQSSEIGATDQRFNYEIQSFQGFAIERKAVAEHLCKTHNLTLKVLFHETSKLSVFKAPASSLRCSAYASRQTFKN